jgi:hypothetical protein
MNGSKMASNELQENVKRFGEQHLLKRGFGQVTSWAFERALSGVTHGVGFVKGVGSREGMFTVDIYWRFTNSHRRVPASAMDCVRRIGELSSGSDEWYPIDDEQSYTRIAEVFAQAAEPFLKSHESIEAILKDYEEGRYPPKMLFGPDIGWMHFNIGFCYLSVGNKEKAADHLREVVDKLSDDPYDWVQERKALAAEGLARALHAA